MPNEDQEDDLTPAQGDYLLTQMIGGLRIADALALRLTMVGENRAARLACQQVVTPDPA